MTDILNLLIPILMVVESGNDPNAVGDNGRAVGVLQIHPEVVEDVNRIYKKTYTLEDRLNVEKSQEICRLYLEFYSRYFKYPSAKTMACIWNGGPMGPKKESTQKYWFKVRLAILKSRKAYFRSSYP